MKDILKKALQEITGVEDVVVEYPANPQHGDYSTNVALAASSVSDIWSSLARTDVATREAAEGQTPRTLAEAIAQSIREDKIVSQYVSQIEVAGPGFINFYISDKELLAGIKTVNRERRDYGRSSYSTQKVMVEYGHPNTHKELHVGHMRTLVVGEALARILSFGGVEVFRANYQGDIGPHVAKAIWGTRKILSNESKDWEAVEKLTPSEKAHLLGQGYALGNKEYEEEKEEIHRINKAIYEASDPEVMADYERTRRWSLEYYDTFYARFDTSYDKLYFESEVSQEGVRLVKEHTPEVFTESEGALVYKGEKNGLHTRVFVTKEGYPTYEGKEIALAFAQFQDFAFDRNVHVVASEQKGYFDVVIDALKQIDPSLGNREYHLSMGMVQLVGKKISSRTGDVFTVDQLLDEVKSNTKKLIKADTFSESEKENISELTTMGAVKYSVLNASAKQDVLFDIQKSIALDGNSGPYLQYTYARIQSVLDASPGASDATTKESETKSASSINGGVPELTVQEREVVRLVYKFPEIVKDAGDNYSPHILCTYLFSLAQSFNAFYASEKIIGNDREVLRLEITKAVGQTLENGLRLLGIEAPKRM